MELKPEGTLLDVISRAEKRGLVERAEELREMKDVRNMIAHDYAGAKAAEIFAYCREQKPVADVICDRVAAYAGQILSFDYAIKRLPHLAQRYRLHRGGICHGARPHRLLCRTPDALGKWA